MEDKNHLPSLPPNYVTLSQLQERWLKQKEKEKQLQEKHQEEQHQKQQQQIPKLSQHNPREYHRGRRPKTQQKAWQAIPACLTGAGHAAVKRPSAEFGPKNPIVQESNRVVVEVSRETNETVEAEADVGDGNDGQDGKKKQRKKKWKRGKWKPRAGEEKKKLAEDATESTIVGNKEVENSDSQRETKIELNGSKSNNLMNEGEEELGIMSMNPENEKQNSRVKTHDSSRGSRRNNGGRNDRIGAFGKAGKKKKKLAEDAAQSTMVSNKEVANSDVQMVDGKGETKIELNGSKSNNLMTEVQQKLGSVSLNPENEKQNSRVKTYDSFRGSRRNNGGRNDRIGPYGRAGKEKKKLADDAAQSTMVGNKEVANSDVQTVDDRRETKIELNGSKSNNLMTEVQQKLGSVSLNSENEKQNSRVKTYDSSRGSRRNNGGRNYRTGPYGIKIRAHDVQWQRVDQKIWVRKSEDSNGNVDRNEISSK
ncbi:uncharacterized protein DDB_G0283357 [Neltuma alba]|uniref:uncharacterized protein DDB_G0283357 n=1 Tax=Neltuma alba TaxID=207710 RepID=UPI0010A566B7|nr:uncharacterized protein DDB_G0283357 [Prosopis alba]